MCGNSKISKIFISHMHGDHVYGLPGLLTTMNLLGRTAEIDLHGPQGLKAYLDANLSSTGVVLSYQVNVFEKNCTELTDFV